MEELPHLPSDIIMDILSRLSFKSILRFKSVSKSWCRTTEDPSLADTHLSRSNEEPGPGLLFTVTVPNVSPQVTKHTSLYFAKDYESFFHVCYYESSKDYQSKERLMCSASTYVSSPHGSCNGLVCFVTSTIDVKQVQVLVCNLTLQEYIILPVDALQTMSGSRSHVYKLAYSPATKEYKVFWYNPCTQRRNFQKKCTQRRGYTQHPVMKIHTLGTCSWRDVLSEPPHPFCGDPVFADGGLHWKVDPDLHSDVDVEHCIISFDIGKEKFYTTNYPLFGCESRFWIDLFEMRGCLAVADLSYGTEHINIWVLRDEDNSNKKQWVNVYILNIKPVAALFRGTTWGGPLRLCVSGFDFIGLWQQDKILFKCRECNTGHMKYVSWDTKTGEMVHMDLSFGGKPDNTRVTACGYTRSIVSLKPYGALALRDC